MKTVQDFIKEIEGSAELQAALKEIKDKDALAAFLKKNDVDGTVEDFGKAIQAKAEAEGEISDDSAEAVAGGISLSNFLEVLGFLPSRLDRGIDQDGQPKVNTPAPDRPMSEFDLYYFKTSGTIPTPTTTLDVIGHRHPDVL